MAKCLGQHVVTYVSDSHEPCGRARMSKHLRTNRLENIHRILRAKNCLLPRDSDTEDPGYYGVGVDLVIGPPSGNRGELSIHNFCDLSAHDCTDILCSSTRILLPNFVSSAAIKVFQPASSSRLKYLSKVSLCTRSVSLTMMRVA